MKTVTEITYGISIYIVTSWNILGTIDTSKIMYKKMKLTKLAKSIPDFKSLDDNNKSLNILNLSVKCLATFNKIRNKKHAAMKNEKTLSPAKASRVFVISCNVTGEIRPIIKNTGMITMKTVKIKKESIPMLCPTAGGNRRSFNFIHIISVLK
jgi:hypothetical protein